MIGLFAAFRAAANAVPGWIYCLFIAVLLAAGAAVVGTAYVQVAQAERAQAGAKAALAQEREWNATELAKATQEAMSAQMELQDAHEALEIANAERQRASADADRRLAAAVAAGAGRLRDPHAAACRTAGPAPQGASHATGGGADPAEAGGLLSVQLTDLLGRLMREAQQVNDAYAACRQDAIDVRRALNATPGG